MKEKVLAITKTKMGPQATGYPFFISHQRPKFTKDDVSLMKLSKDPEKTSIIQIEPSATVSGFSGYRGHRLDSHGQSDQLIGANLAVMRTVGTRQILQPRATSRFDKEELEGEAALQQARSRAWVRLKSKGYIYGDMEQRPPTVLNFHSPLSFRRRTPKL